MTINIEQLRTRFQSLLEELKNDLNADIITMYLYDTEHGRPFLPVGVGLRDNRTFKTGIPDLNRAAGEVIRNGEPIFANNVLNHPNLIGPFVYREGVQSVALLPLKQSTGKLIGLIYINFRHLIIFDPKLREIISNHIKELVSSLEKELEIDSENAPVYRNIAPEESQTRLEIFLQRSINSIRDSLGSVSTAIWTLDESENLKLDTFAGIPENFKNYRIPIDSKDFTADAFREKQTTKIEDIESSHNFNLKDVATEMRWRSAIAIPLIAPNQQTCFGILTAYTVDHLLFSRPEETILHSFAISISAQIESDRRYKSLNSMNELGASLLQTLDLTEIMKRVVEVTAAITDAYVCLIHLYDAAKKEFLDRSQSAINKENILTDVTDKPRSNTGLSAYILKNGWIELEDVSTLSEPIELSPFIQQAGIQSLLGVRLEAQNQPLGVLIIGFRNKRAFSVDESTIVRSLTYYATLAIVQAQHYEQRLAYGRASHRITKAQNREELLSVFLEDCLELINSEQGAVGTVDYRTGDIRITHAVNQRSGYVVPAGKGLMGVAVATQEALRVNNVEQDPRYHLIDKDIKSELDVPLIVEGRVIGVLNAKSPRLSAFNDEHEEMIEELADEAAAALNRFNLDERLQRRTVLSQNIAGASSREELLNVALSGMAELINSEIGLYGDVNRRTEEIRMVQNLFEELQERGWDVPHGMGLTRKAVEDGKPIYVENVTKDKKYKDFYHTSHQETLAELDIPLNAGEKYFGFGVLSFQSPREKAFTAEDIDVALAVSGEVAVALRKFNLQERLRITDEFGEELTSGVRLTEDEIFDLILEKTIEIVDTNNMYIALYDEPTNTIRFSLVFEEGQVIDIESIPEVEASDRWQPRRGGNGRTERILELNQPQLIRTLDEARKWHGKPDTPEYGKTFWSSWIGVPMRVGENTLGVIVAYHPDKDNFFDYDDLNILHSIGNKAAIALDNSRLHYNLNRRLETLTEVSKELTNDIFRTEQEIVERIYSYLHRTVETENMYIALYDETKDEVSFPLAINKNERVDTGHDPNWQPRQGGRGRTEWIIHNREPILIADNEESIAWYEHPDREEYQGRISPSWFGTPIFIGERVLGVIALYNDINRYVYNSEDLIVVQSIADLGAVLLDNARLYREIRIEAIAAKQLATLGTAMALIQHRINNSFNVIRPNVRRLRTRVGSNDRTIDEILDIIDRNAEYGAKMINEIQGKLRNVEVIHPVNINNIFNSVLDDSLRRWGVDSQYSKIDIVRDFEEEIPDIDAPKEQIDELFSNLIENAYRSMEGKGKLHVSTYMEGNNIFIRVQDSGKGIPAEVMTRLFKKPIAKSIIEKTEGGTGLGLWLNSLFLDLIGGTIEVESTGEDGTTMIVKIPSL